MKDIPKFSMSDIAGDAELVSPLALFYVKGWTRSVAAVAIMACCYEKEAFLEADLVSFLAQSTFST